MTDKKYRGFALKIGKSFYVDTYPIHSQGHGRGFYFNIGKQSGWLYFTKGIPSLVLRGKRRSVKKEEK